MSAAKSSARCSEPCRASARIRSSSPRASPSISRASISRPRASVASCSTRCTTMSRSPVTATSSTSSRATTAAAPACSGARRATSPATWCSGVSDGFTINLEINGVGYRAQADAKNLKLQLGFSHDVEVPIPAGIQIKALKPTEIEITGADRQKVGPARGRDPQPASARALQGQGHQVLDRDDPAQGRQEEVEAIHVQDRTPFSPAASGARATSCARLAAAVRASASSARASTSMPRSSTTVRGPRSLPPRRSTRTSRASSRPAPTSRRRSRSAS